MALSYSTLSSVANTLKKLFASRSDLDKAIKAKNKKEFLYLIDEAKVNFTTPDEYHNTPLLLTLQQRLFDYTFELLERGASANTTYRICGSVMPLLQGEVYVENESSAKLLILYGADTQKAFADNPYSPHKKKLLELRKFYLDEIKPCLDQANFLAFEKLNAIWQKISQEESHPALRVCYQKKANQYKEKAQLLKPQPSTAIFNTTFASTGDNENAEKKCSPQCAGVMENQKKHM